MSSPGYQYTATVVHRGVVFAFTAGDDPTTTDIYYNVLDLELESKNDALDWSGFRALEFPDQLRTVGMGLITVPTSTPTTGGVAHAPFQVLSDQQYVYVFRQSLRGTLYCTRFSLVEEPGGRESDETIRSLRPAWEVRFKRSGKRDIPASERDVPSYQDAAGTKFIEPTLELSMVANLVDGRFAVVLVPSQLDDRPRWQLFSFNQASGRIDMFSFARDEAGLFEVTGKEVDPATDQIPPDASFAMSISDGEAATPLNVVTGMSALFYSKQERATTDGGEDVALKRNGRVMLAVGVEPAAGGSATAATRATAVIDFAVARDGTLAHIAEATTLGKVDPADHTLFFDEVSYVALADQDKSLDLTGSFTLEVWVLAEELDSDERSIIGGDAGEPETARAPYLRVAQGVLTAGFADQSLSTPGRVLEAGAWNHLAATFDAATGAFVLYVNGTVQTSAILPGAQPPGTPIAFLGSAADGFIGNLDEVRVWKTARSQAELVEYLYRELPDPAADPNLVGYWKFDRIEEVQGVLTAPDLSQYGNTGTLHGPRIEASTSPVITANSAALQIDDKGLTIEAGLLEFVSPAATPYLLDGSDGLVHVYFQGADREMEVAQYDAAVARAIYHVPWTAPASQDGEEGGSLALIAHRAGPLMNRCEVAVVASERAELCTLEIKTAQGVTESWRGLPRILERFAEVLSGDAVGDPSDRRLATGKKHFYDYAGNHPTSWLDTDSGTLLVITRRPTADADHEPVPGGMALQSVAVSAVDPETRRCTVRLELLPESGGAAIPQVWTDVPIAVGDFVATLNAMSQGYDYAAPGAGTPPVYSLAAGSSKVLLFGRSTDLTAATLTVSAGSANDRCKVAVELTAGEALRFEMPDVSRDQNAIAAALRAATQVGGTAKLIDYLFATSDGLIAGVPDQVATYGDGSGQKLTDGLLAAASMFEVVADGATGDVHEQSVAAATLQGAVSSDEHADLGRGSALFAAAPVTIPTSGHSASIQDTPDADLWQPGVAGGWLAEPPRFALEFASNDVSVDVLDDKASALYLRGDLTIEAWVNPAGTVASSHPRVIHYAKKGSLDDPDDYAQYMLGCSESGFLLTVSADNVGTSIALAPPVNVGALFTAGAYTVQLWMQPNLATIGDAPAQVWRKSCDDGGTTTSDTLALAADGTLTFAVVSGPDVTTTVTSKRKIASNAWTHVSVVRNGGTLRLFVDGVLEGEETDAPSARNSNRFVLAGNTGANVLETGMNDLRTWSRALAADEIAANYATYVPADSDGLTLEWGLSEGEGQTVRNAAQTGAQYDGTIQNSYHWRSPGVFYKVFAGSRRKVVGSANAVVTRDQWTHLAAVYDTAHAVQFSGTEFADCGNDASLDFDQAFGIDLWITPTRVGGDALAQALISKWGVDRDQQSYELGLDVEGRPYLKIHVREGDKDQDLICTAASSISPGVAHHLAATVELSDSDNGEDPPEVSQTIKLTIYLDGVQDAEAVTSIVNGRYEVNGSTVALQFARTRPDATGPTAPFLQSYYAGYMSDVRLWSRALTEADATDFATPGGPTSDDGLVGFWPFAEMDGTVAFDQKGVNNARLSSNSLWRLYDANAMLTLYVDGAPVTPGPRMVASDVDGYGDQQLRLGAMKSAGATLDAWNGAIDEIRLWSTSLAQEQLTDSMYRTLAGNETGLAAYWKFDAGSGRTIADQTGRGNDGTMEPNGSGVVPKWVVSTAPISNEGPVVRNVLGGVHTPDVAHITGSPAACDYPDVQRDNAGEIFSVIKRLYMYVDTGKVTLRTGFKTGDLAMTYIGQIQTKPKLIGYIEGAPPLPSENLSRPLYNDPHFNDFRYYATSSKITMTQASEVARAYSSTKKTGFDLAAELKAGLFFVNEIKGGSPFLHKDLIDLDGHLGLQASFDYSTGTETEREAGASRSKTISSSLDCGGEWEEEGPEGWLNPLVGRRFLPENNGYALVKSLTADLFAQTLKSTGALVALTAVPNNDIPEDVNILAFPIDPIYTKNGTLDGKVGLKNDPSYPSADVARGSYFKPLEAYTLKRRIERQTMQLEAYWNQFDAEGRGQGGNADLDDVVADDPYYDWKRGVARKSIVNTYVWTAEGGLYKEEEDFSSTSGESHAGEYEFKGMGGLAVDGMGAFFGVGFYAEVDFLLGGHLDVTVIKKREDKQGFGLEVELECDRFLKRFLGDASHEPYSKTPCPGKVNGYRFLSFYLAPDRRNNDQFSKVVDAVWLARSDEASAVALREATFDENGVWRIFHRVTYVSRVPPEFQPVPDESQAPDVTPPANVEDNEELIQLVAHELGEKEPTPVNIGAAVNQVLDVTLTKTLPWWELFLRAAEEFESDAQKTLRALRGDLLAYMIDAYETVLAEDTDLIPTLARRT